MRTAMWLAVFTFIPEVVLAGKCDTLVVYENLGTHDWPIRSDRLIFDFKYGAIFTSGSHVGSAMYLCPDGVSLCTDRFKLGFLRPAERSRDEGRTMVVVGVPIEVYEMHESLGLGASVAYKQGQVYGFKVNYDDDDVRNYFLVGATGISEAMVAECLAPQK